MKKNTEYKNNFIRDNYDRINFTVPKGVKEKIKSRSEELGISVNSYIYSLIIKDNPSLSAKKENTNMDIFLL